MEDLHRRATRLEQEKRALLEMGEVLVSELDPDRLLKLVADKTRELLSARTVLIPLIDADVQTYTYRAGSGETAAEAVGESLPMDMGICGWVWKHQRPWWHGVLEELEAHERTQWEDQAGSVMLVPLVGKRNFLGGIACIDKKNGEDFDQRDLELLKLFAQQVAIAIENANLFLVMEHKVAERTRELEKAIAAAESANRMKSEFLANMSHEIRTPLTAIIGFAECILESGQTMEQRLQAIRTIISSGRHLLSLINDILDISKVEAEHLTVESLALSPTGLMDDVQAIIAPQAVARELRFSIDYQWPLPAEIHSDPVRLKQILINLCGNALKFTHAGEITIRLRGDTDKRQLIFEVIDTGIGMSEAQQARIFEQFTQADVSTTREYGGTGLGLYLSHMLAKKLGGDLSVASAPGQGSRFSLTLQLDAAMELEWLQAPPDVEAGAAAAEPVAQTRLQGRVLLVEDNEINQQLIAHLITRTGADVSIAGNGEEAVHMAPREDFDLVLMDIQMPVMDGMEATRRLRLQNYDAPVIALTANVMAADIAGYKQGGFDGHLAKPLDKALFDKTLQAHLQVVDEATPACTPIRPEGGFDDPALAAMLERFLDSLAERVQQARVYTDGGDWEALKKEIHNLKGMGGSFGYPQLSELCGSMQFEITKKDYAETRQSMQALEQLVEAILLGRQQLESV